MVLIAHAADLVALGLPAVGFLVWLLLTTLRQRREERNQPQGESPDNDRRPSNG